MYIYIYSLSGDKGNQWRMGAVNVIMGAEFYFIIEGNLINHRKKISLDLFL